MTEIANSEQGAQWNGAQGESWLANEAMLEPMMGETDVILAEAARAAPGEAVLDIGCGTGGGSIAYARRTGPGGRVLGVDISAPLLARAEERRREAGLANLAFLLADAQIEPMEGPFDLMVSRFGVMFFEDPVAAFRNIARAIRPGGRICFVSWTGPDQNPWFAVPKAAAEAVLGSGPPADPNAPGPMAFGDIDRVLGILGAAGLAGAAGERRTFQLATMDIAAAAGLAARVGPAARLVREKAAGAAEIEAIVAEVRARFAPFVTASGLRIPGEINLFHAHRA